MKRLTAFLILTGYHALWARARDGMFERHENGKHAILQTNRAIEQGLGSRVRWSSVPTCLRDGLTIIHGPMAYGPVRKKITFALAYFRGFTS